MLKFRAGKAVGVPFARIEVVRAFLPDAHSLF